MATRGLDWIGLHLFNDDTRPSGHISRPSQVGFSNSYLCSINEDLWWCSVVEINSTLECSHLMTDLNKKLCWIYGLSYQIKESSFSQKLYRASLRDRLKEGLQWVNCVVLIFVATLYIPGVCVQWSESGHNAGKQSVVLGTRYGILWPCYGQFEVRLSQPPQLWSGARISWMVLVLVSGGTDLHPCIDTSHLIWTSRWI